MADVDLTVQDVSRSGVAPSYTSPLGIANTYHVPNNGRMVLHFKKTGAGACTVTITTPGTVDGLAVADRTVVVPELTGDVMIGPFPPATYNDADHEIRFTVSEVTGLSVAALRI